MVFLSLRNLIYNIYLQNIHFPDFDNKQYLEVTDYQLFAVNTVEKWIGFYLWVYGK